MMIIIEENELQLYVSNELKKIAKNLDATYIDKSNSNINKGIIKIGAITINIVYKDIITDIRVNIDRNKVNIDCTDSIAELTNLCMNYQKASLIVKSIQESNLMNINDIGR